MTTAQSIITILAVVFGTMITRFLPFIIFPEGKKPPAYIAYLGTVLPYAVIGLLVLLERRCFHGLSRFAGVYFNPLYCRSS